MYFVDEFAIHINNTKILQKQDISQRLKDEKKKITQKKYPNSMSLLVTNGYVMTLVLGSLSLSNLHCHISWLKELFL